MDNYTTKPSARTRHQTAQQVAAFESVVQKRRKLAREAANRHVLAASTIRAWIARTCLSRRLHRRKRIRDNLKLRWEPEIQRIAATRIQAVARGAIGRGARLRAARAAVDIQRVERGWRARSAVNELSRKRYARRLVPSLLDTCSWSVGNARTTPRFSFHVCCRSSRGSTKTNGSDLSMNVTV